MKNFNWLFAAIAFMGVLVLFLLYRDMRRDQEMAMLMSRQSIAPGKDGRAPVDPYMQNEVKNRIIKGYGDLQVCYRSFLKTNPKTTDGELKMDWQIDADGDVFSPEWSQVRLSRRTFTIAWLEKSGPGSSLNRW